MQVIPLSPAQRQKRQHIAAKVKSLQEAGACPTCASMRGEDVYPPADARLFYEDEHCLCLLEQYPRNPGHTIVLLKEHREDLAALDPQTAAALWPVVHRAVAALKTRFGADKVYMCTMCDGRRNHLHLQLIPRLPGDPVRGSRLFVKERGFLKECARDIAELGSLMNGPGVQTPAYDTAPQGA